MSKVKQITAWLCGVSLFLLLAGCWEGDSKRLENAFDRAKYGTTKITLAVSDNTTLIEVGQQVSFIVTGYDKDDAQRIIPSDKIEWSLNCSISDCAFLSDKGVLTGRGDGIATVTANYDTLSASVDVEVSSATLASIEIKQVDESKQANRCEPIELKAFGSYEKDGVPVPGIRDITQLASWSSESAEATVYKDSNGKVIFSSGSVNAVTIKASHASYQSDTETGEKDFTVKNELPVVTLTPSGITTVFTGQTKQYSAAGTWPDGSSSSNITHNLSWTSEDSAIAAFNGNTTSSTLSVRQDGLLTGVSASNNGTSISASCGTDVRATQTVLVRKLEIESIKIYRESDSVDYDGKGRVAYDIQLNSTATFRAEAVYVGGNVEGVSTDITQDCTWKAYDGNTSAIYVGDADAVDNDSTPLKEKRGSVTGNTNTANSSPDWARVRVILKSCEGEQGCPKEDFDVRVIQ